MEGVCWQLLREQQILVQRRSLPRLASKRREQGRQRLVTYVDIYSQMAESAELAFPAFFLFWVQAPNVSASRTRGPCS